MSNRNVSSDTTLKIVFMLILLATLSPFFIFSYCYHDDWSMFVHSGPHNSIDQTTAVIAAGRPLGALLENIIIWPIKTVAGMSLIRFAAVLLLGLTIFNFALL